MTRRVMRSVLAVVAVSSLTRPLLSQAVDSTGTPIVVTWAVNLANKGISVIPISTFDKPTATVDVYARRGDFSIDPQFRFGVDGTPWSGFVAGRYRVVDGPRSTITISVAPVLSFRTASIVVNGVAREAVVAQHFAAGELTTRYAVARSVSVGTYYLYSRGLDGDVTRHTHMLAARAAIANLGLPARLVVRLDPQLYYLGMDDRDGVYLNSRVTLARHGLPVSISGIVNRSLRTTIARGRGLLWNVSLNYALAR